MSYSGQPFHSALFIQVILLSLFLQYLFEFLMFSIPLLFFKVLVICFKVLSAWILRQIVTGLFLNVYWEEKQQYPCLTHEQEGGYLVDKFKNPWCISWEMKDATDYVILVKSLQYDTTTNKGVVTLNWKVFVRWHFSLMSNFGYITEEVDIHATQH